MDPALRQHIPALREVVVWQLDERISGWMAPGSGGAAAVEGVPTWELTRSPAAARVGAAAAAEGLLLYHFEHRVGLPLPDAWLADGVEADRPEWVDGVLAEPKYASFRHDLGVGSFHPSHRAKWSAHELCHGLVGTAWRPGASPLFHATAGRLAELIPVVLWYFLDEIHLRRCPRHDGPLYRVFCADCEQAATEGPAAMDERHVRRWLGAATDFVDAELAAIRRTRASGTLVPHIRGSLDLCSDGVAYAVAHGPRLDSDGFAAWAERFLPERLGGHRDLDALEARVIEVFDGLLAGEVPTRGASRDDWVAQDLAARVLQGAHGDADAVDPVWERLLARDWAGARAEYEDRADALGWLHPLDVFAPGYALAGGGAGLDQVEEGLRSVVPMTLQLADDAGIDVVGPFVAADRPERRPLGLRFAAWIRGAATGHVAGLTAYEAALRAASADAEALALGGGEGARWARGVSRWEGDFDPVGYAEAVDAGEVEGMDDGGRLDAPAPEPAPTALAIGRDAAGELVLAEVPLGVFGAPPAAWDPDVRDALFELGLVVPERYSL